MSRHASHPNTKSRDGSIDLTVVICTHNRARSLERSLASIERAAIPDDCRWEILLVDNRSTDSTATTALTWSDRLPLRYLYEPEPGLSAARNRALQEARGRLLLFTDDDVEVDRDWMTAMMAARRQWPAAGYLAGAILPVYERRPTWLTDGCEAMLAGVVIRFNLPRSPGPLTDREPRPMGANLAFDADALRSVGGFRTDLGRNGSSLVGGEEVAVLTELEQTHRRGVYVPQALVHHHTGADRLRWRFLLRYFAAVGIAGVRMAQIAPEGRPGPPRWMLRKVLAAGAAFLSACLVGSPERRIVRMRSFGYYLGACWEMLRTAGRRRRLIRSQRAGPPRLPAPG